MAEQTIPQQLAAKIDQASGLDVSTFFNEDGTLRPIEENESVMAYNIACSLLVYETDSHNDYKTNVANMIQGDIDLLQNIQSVVENFPMPDSLFPIGGKVYFTDPDEGKCSGVYTLNDINGEVFRLSTETSELEAYEWELRPVQEGDE
jgi:hypothetical protein